MSSPKANLEVLPPSIRFVLALSAVALLAFPFVGSDFYTQMVTRMMILGIFAMSLDLLQGVTGLVSLGHAAYFGLAGYVLAFVTPQGEAVSLWWTLPAAVLASGLAALVIGFFVVRTRGIYFIMVTLAFAQMLFFVTVGLKQYGGDEGLSIARLSSFGALTGSKTALYLSVLAALAVALLLLRRVVASRFGLVLRATMINERRVNAVGTPPLGYRLVGYVVSALLCALAGFFLANLTSFASPAYMAWTVSGELIVMVLLGGMGTLMGPVVGALVFLLLEEGLKGLTDHWLVILGPIIVLIVLFLKNGLWGILSHAPAARGGH